MQLVTFNGVAGQPLVNRKGAVSGARMVFSGSVTASEVRLALKAEGLKGNALKKKANEVLNGTKDLAWAKQEAAVSVLRSQGYIPDYVDVRKSGASVRFVKPAEVKEKTEADRRAEALKLLGLDEETLKVLTAGKK